MKASTRHIILLVWVNVCRALLAAAFVFSGFVKAVDPMGTLYKMEDYLAAFGLPDVFPQGLLIVGAVALSALEFTVGMFMLLGIRRRISSVLALLLMLVMTPLTLYVAVANPVHDCGCFGDAWVVTNWQSFGKNVVLLVAAVSTARWSKHIVRFLTQQVEWIVSTYTTLYILVFSFYCLMFLPVLDFRPYRTGADLREATDFSRGELPAIQDFYLEDMLTGEDLTDTVLQDTGYTFLLVAHRVEEADDSDVDLINEIYDYSLQYGYRFLALTASDEAEVEEWRDLTGGEYTFCRADDIALKTIVRSNPGMLLLHDGVIVGKWSHRNLPDEYALTGPLDQIAVGQVQSSAYGEAMVRVLLWFLVPLLLVVVLDQTFKKRRHKPQAAAGPQPQGEPETEEPQTP